MTPAHEFPESFWWGTGASSPQSEGAAPASDWLAWERAGRLPASGDGNGFGTRFREDFELYAAHGLTHHRMGIEWARIEPEDGVRDPVAVEHYRTVLEAAREAGIEPWACLHHFVLPDWVGDGGFRDWKAIRDRWCRHVEFVAETYGDLVAGWKPINEPIAYALAGFLSGHRPPGEHDRALMLEALEGIHLAKYEAARILHQTGKPVATIHVLIPMFPGDSTPSSAAALEELDQLVWGCWIGALRDGVLQIPHRTPVEVPDYPEVFDLVGFSYYFSATVGADGKLGPYPPGAEVGLMGYVPWSGGLGLVLDRLARELPGRPLLVSEHGVGTHDDEMRSAFLKESLGVVSDRLTAGLDIRGFFHWTGVDNYEWNRAFDVPFGLFDRDRRPKGSAALLRSYALRHDALAPARPAV